MPSAEQLSRGIYIAIGLYNIDFTVHIIAMFSLYFIYKRHADMLTNRTRKQLGLIPQQNGIHFSCYMVWLSFIN